MTKIVLESQVKNTSSNSEGIKLYNILEEAFTKKDKVILKMDNETSLSSSFLNSSIGNFLESYGLENFKKTVKFNGSRTQFMRIKKYIDTFSELYLN